MTPNEMDRLIKRLNDTHDAIQAYDDANSIHEPPATSEALRGRYRRMI